MPAFIRATLPVGAIGVTFKDEPPVITKISDDSPMANKLQVGMVVSEVDIPGKIKTSGMSTSELVRILKAFSDVKGRVLAAQHASESGRMGSVSMVTLPPGSIGVSFAGSPPRITKISDNSPVAVCLEIGQLVEELIVPDEMTMKGMNTSELVRTLKAFSNTEGRVLVVKDDNVAETSRKRMEYSERVTAMVDFCSRAVVEGDENQLLTVDLEPGETVRGEPGAMLSMTEHIKFETRARGTTGWLSGESFFLTEFTYEGPAGTKGTLTFGGEWPGKIIPIRLEEYGGYITCHRGGLLVTSPEVKVAAIGGNVFGEGLFLQRLYGKGYVFICASGTISRRVLRKGEKLKVSTGALVAFEKGVKHGVERIKGFRNLFFGGEGLFVSTVTGPGTIWLESAPFEKVIQEIRAEVRD